MKTTINFAIATMLAASFPAMADVIWSGGDGGWVDSTKWIGGLVPGSTDHAVIGTGQVSLTGPVIVDSLTLINGVIKNRGSLTTNNLYWTNGNINFANSEAFGYGNVVVNGHAVLGDTPGSLLSLENNEGIYWDCENCNYSRMFLNGTAELHGIIYATSGDLINNGTLTLKNGADIRTSYFGRSGSPLQNNGIIDVDAGAGGIAQIYNHYSNDKTVRVTSGTLELGYGYGSFQNQSDGFIHVKQDAELSLTGDWEIPFTNNGEVIVDQGGKIRAGSYNQNGGKTVIKNGILQTSEYTYEGVTVNGGEFIVSGNIIGNVNVINGDFSLGQSPQSLGITGDLFLGENSNLYFDIAGLVQGISYDWVAVSGTSFLDGVLNIDFSFNPLNTSTYTLLSGLNIDNEFSLVNVNGLDLSKYSYQLDYSTSAVILTITAVPEPSSYAMLGFGILMISAVSIRRSNKRKQ